MKASIGWLVHYLSGFNAATRADGLSAMVWELPLRMVQRNIITIFILYIKDSFLSFNLCVKCDVKNLTVISISENLTPSYPCSFFRPIERHYNWPRWILLHFRCCDGNRVYWKVDYGTINDKYHTRIEKRWHILYFTNKPCILYCNDLRGSCSWESMLIPFNDEKFINRRNFLMVI